MQPWWAEETFQKHLKIWPNPNIEMVMYVDEWMYVDDCYLNIKTINTVLKKYLDIESH